MTAVVITIVVMALVILGLVVWVISLLRRKPDERIIYIDSGEIMRDKELEQNEKDAKELPPPSADDVLDELKRIRSGDS